jgi:hypothetical protein
MSVLGDLLLDALVGGAGPSSDRGVVGTFAGVSCALMVATGWLLVTSPNPIQEPEWGMGVLALSVAWGVGGLVVSVLHLYRNQSDRRFGLVCLAFNVGAVAVPALWTITR